MNNDKPYPKSDDCSSRCRIIAEAGVNHNGSLPMALELIDVAAEAGADAVKFQTFKATSVISQFAPKAEYQQSSTGNEGGQLEMVRSLELSFADHHVLIEHCKNRGIRFLSTPFDVESARFLVRDLGLEEIKIPSGEITNAVLLYEIASHGRPVILSTGMSTLGDIEKALGVLAFGYLNNGQQPSKNAFATAYVSDAGQAILAEKVTLLHCTTEYPAPYQDTNLRALEVLRLAFGLPVGLSDHTDGIAIAIAASALGATIVEKHFTLDRMLAGPDHKASIEPEQLGAMVAGIRQVTMALGNGRKRPTISELKNIPIARKSLVAARPIRAGELFSEANIAIKRPAGGISPFEYWTVLGRLAGRDYCEDEALDDV